MRYVFRMRPRTSIRAALAVALALLAPAQASACRTEGVRNLFAERPAPEGLAGAQVVRVRFTNAAAALEGVPRHSADVGGDILAFSLVGVARPLGPRGARGEAFPVYAIVTTCSPFFVMATGGAGYSAIDGDYYLVGRFVEDGRGRRFLAAGNRGGRWHY